MRERSIFNLAIWGVMLGAAAFAQPAAKADFAVLKGYDLFTTEAGSSYDFPGFGSQDLMGVPLGTYNFGAGAVNVGTTDTIIQRTQNIFAPANGTGTSALAVDALQLETVNTVTYGAETGHLFVTLDPSMASTGSISITFNATGTGGTFTSSLDLYVNISFGNTLATSTVIASDVNLTLSNSGDTWGRIAPVGAEKIDGINYKLDHRNTNTDFWPGPDLTEMHPGAGQHVVDPASVPEPGTGMMAALAAVIGLAGAGWNRRRGRA